jgi:outer membrane protein assembly factor BamB
MFEWLLWSLVAVQPGAAFGGPAAVPPEWNQFRGPGGCGVAPAGFNPPLHLDPERNLAWKTALPEGLSSPILVGTAVLVTAFEPGKLATICLDRESGALRWRRDVAVAEFEPTYQHGPATPTPVSDGQRLFSVFGSFGIVAHDLAGHELWRKPWPVAKNTFGSASSPVIMDGRLIVFAGHETESVLMVLKPDDGEVIWERRRPGPASSWSTPVAWRTADSTAIVFYEPFALRACSLEDGDDLWSVPGLADEPVTIPLVGDGLIYTTSYNLRTNTEASGLPAWEQLVAECDSDADGQISRAESDRNRSILSRPDADGQGDHPLSMFFRMLDKDRDGQIAAAEWPAIEEWMRPWNHANGFIAVRPGDDGTGPFLAWEHAAGVPECPSPLLLDGKLFAVRNGGVVTCLDALTGTQLSQGRWAAPGPRYASPVAANGHLYLVSGRGVITVLTAEATPVEVSTLDLGEAVWATPAIGEQEILYRSGRHLWMFRDK